MRFLKDEYGIGGRSHALSGATHSGEDHDGKGLHYKKEGLPGCSLELGKGCQAHYLPCPERTAILPNRNRRSMTKSRLKRNWQKKMPIQAQQPEVLFPHPPFPPTVWNDNYHFLQGSFHPSITMTTPQPGFEDRDRIRSNRSPYPSGAV